MSRDLLRTLLVCCLVAAALGCSMPVGWRPPTTAEVIQRSRIVFLGTVTQTFPDRYSRTRYTAEMEVHCIIKGPRVGSIVSIDKAGYEPGLCVSVNLSPGNTYFVMVEEGDDGGWQAAQEATIKLSAQSGPAVASVCGLDIQYPFGVDNETANFACPIRRDDPATCL